MSNAKENVIKYEQSSHRKTVKKNNGQNDILSSSSSSTQHLTQRCKHKKLWIILGILLPILIIAIITVIVLYKKNQKKCSTCTEGIQEEDKPDPFSVIIPVYPENYQKLESEFEYKTKVGDLRRIHVNQKTEEDRVYEGKNIKRINERDTLYYIYIISESNPEPDFINYYNKIYTAAISIAKECFATDNEDCVPETLVDLSGAEIHNSRNLEEANDLKDIPIPFCLFNLTNNDVITSIACHESFSEYKKKLMVLDLYFFRPPGLKRPDKEELNVTITKEIRGDNLFIRETNGGICDIENSISSFCTTDMNTTSDKEGNILHYEEVAYMNIETDELNSYTKNKITKLVDLTNETKSFEPEKYKTSLNQLLPLIKPYFKYDELFSKEDFEEILIVSKKGGKELKNINSKRKLQVIDIPKGSIENTLLNFDGNSGVNFEVNLINNPGIDKENQNMEGISKLKIENKNKELSSSKKSSLSIKDIIQALSSLSEAGNKKATQLYQSLNITLQNMTEVINNEISYLNSLLKYKDLSDIFDATLSLDAINKLPFAVIQESSNLKAKLEQILSNIENGGITKNIKILNNDIYSYTTKSQIIINQLLENLSDLTKSLSSSKSKLTEISTYYCSNTTHSYLGVIEKAEKILMNYYKDEYALVDNKVQGILKDFVNEASNSLQKQMNIINSLYDKISSGNYTIENAEDNHLRIIIDNLYYIKNYLNELINKIKIKVNNEMEKKDNGYLMSNYDINSIYERAVDEITNAKEIAKKLDNDQFIDTKFDEVYTHFRENFTNIIKFMDKEKEELFPLRDDVLNNSYDVQNDMKNEINDEGVKILNNIRKENEEYLKEKNKVIEDFKKYENYLNTLTFEIEALFTEKNLGEIAQLYEIAYNSCLSKTTNELNVNNNSAFIYFSDLAKIMQDNNKLITLLKTYKADNSTLLKHNPYSSLKNFSFNDTLKNKYKTQNYLNKFKIFIESFSSSREFINNQIYGELLSEYKNIMFKLRQVLHNFINNKMTDKYPDTIEFSFIDNHINQINNLYTRLDNKISDSIFNSKYISIINNFKKNSIDALNKIEDFIEQKHKIINLQNYENNINYDFCFTFSRKISYTCTNGCVSTHTESDKYCFPVNNNYQNLLKHSIYTDTNYLAFINKFNQFYSQINERVNNYTSIINELKERLLNAESKAINKQYTFNYLSPIENSVNRIITEKYGDKLIKNTYNYYQTNIKGLLGPLLNSITNKWNDSFNALVQEINDNLDNFKHSITEFNVMAVIYSILIKNNITNNYAISIETHQKNEFNYTISYYYNILIKLVKSTHQYIINKIPNNRVGYNNILDLRKTEINSVFNSLIDKIEQSKSNALNIVKQCNVVQVPKTNFFKINDELSTNILETDKSLQAKITELTGILANYGFSKTNDEFSLTGKFYKENQISKIQIDELYGQINQKVFVFLNLEKFEEILIGNWIFDQDEFINELNNTLYNSNLQIEKEFSTQKQNYRDKLEKYMTSYFTKETLINSIYELYTNEIRNLESNEVELIKQYIQEILNKIKLYIKDETNILLNTLTSYNNNFTKINNRINSYKTEIFNKLNDTVFSVLEIFYQNLNNIFHRQYVLAHLDQCISVSKSFTETYNDFTLLNSTFKIKEILDNMVDNIANEIKNTSKNQIDYIYKESYDKIKKKVELNNLQNLINNQINQEFNSILLKALEQKATVEPGITGYIEYDFNNTVLENVEALIQKNMGKIQSIINSTKGSNYDINVNTWERDCSEIYRKIEEIHTSFNKFMINEEENENDNIEEYLQKIIKNNFNNLLNNIIPSFGNEFFERIIKYNENFKISSLYDSLTYSLSQTISYYLFLQSPDVFSALTKDLKLKLFTLNDLDITIQEKNNEVLQMLEEEIEQFIINSKEFLINKYKSYFISDLSIELSFNDNIRNKIKDIFNKVQNEIETDYINLLNKYFKTQLSESYSKVMNTKTLQMINTVIDERESFKSKIDDYFTLEPDDVLNDINLKLNNTNNSIEDYKVHFKTFKISDDINNFLNNYAEKSIKPNFEKFIDIANEATKDKINSTVERNSIDYINFFNLEEFMEQTEKIYLNIAEQYFDKINNSISIYGIDEYPDNLEKQIDAINENKRNKLGRILTEEEIINNIKEKVADKAIDETFSKLLTSSNISKIFINSLDKFDKFSKEVEKHINNLNSRYKYSLNLIKRNNYEIEVHNLLVQKLQYLYTKTLEYYSNITESYDMLKNYLNTSINEIDSNLNKCADITFKTFAEKYINISKEVTSINEEDTKIVESISDSFDVPNQNNAKINVSYNIANMIKDVKYIYDLVFEGDDVKKPIVKLSVINKSRPSKIEFNLSEHQNDCGRIVESVKASIKGVIYTLNVDYFTNSTDLLYINTFGDFESYYINKELYEIKEKTSKKCHIVLGNEYCVIVTSCDEKNPNVLSNNTNILVRRKLINDNNTIPLDY